jgi:hypothetical protein
MTQGGTVTDVTNLLVGIVVLGLVVYRQIIARPLNGNFRLPLLLGVIGVVELVSFLKGKHVTGTLEAGLAGSLVLAAVFGAARALVTRVWVQDGQPWRKGGWPAGLLWVVAVAAHLGYDQFVYKNASLGSITILLYLAVSLVVQGVILQAKALRLPNGGGGFNRSRSGPR